MGTVGEHVVRTMVRMFCWCVPWCIAQQFGKVRSEIFGFRWQRWWMWLECWCIRLGYGNRCRRWRWILVWDPRWALIVVVCVLQLLDSALWRCKIYNVLVDGWKVWVFFHRVAIVLRLQHGYLFVCDEAVT